MKRAEPAPGYRPRPFDAVLPFPFTSILGHAGIREGVSRCLFCYPWQVPLKPESLPYIMPLNKAGIQAREARARMQKEK